MSFEFVVKYARREVALLKMGFGGARSTRFWIEVTRTTESMCHCLLYTWVDWFNKQTRTASQLIVLKTSGNFYFLFFFLHLLLYFLFLLFLKLLWLYVFNSLPSVISWKQKFSTVLLFKLKYKSPKRCENFAKS